MTLLSTHPHNGAPVASPFHMTEQTLSARRRRRQSDRGPRPNDTSQHQPKRQKLSHPTQLPPAFWDNLSEIPLIRKALQELDRRNVRSPQTSRSLSHTQARRPVIRRAAAVWGDNHQPTAEFLAHCTPTCLKRIERSARHGGPDLSDLRGYRDPDTALDGMSSSQSSGRQKRSAASRSKSKTTSNTTTTESTGPYDRAFQQHLIDHGIYPDGYEYPDGQAPPPPDNLDEILQALAQPRRSLSPPGFNDDDFRKFRRADAHASKEAQVTTSVIPIIEGDIGDSKCVAGQISFTNLEPLTDGSLVAGNPDRYYGARPEQLDRRARAELSGLIIPSTQHDLPILPNCFLAAKGPDGSLAVAGRQACNDGALGAIGFHGLQSYAKGEPVFDNNAYTITSIYHGGTLRMYTSHPIPPRTSGERPDIVMTLINSWSMNGNGRAGREGAAAYRNGVKWAKEQRDEAIKQANESAARFYTDTSSRSFNTAVSFASELPAVDTIEQTSRDTLAPLDRDSDTSADELSIDTAPLLKRSRMPLT